MFLHYLIILISIIYTTSGQETSRQELNVTEARIEKELMSESVELIIAMTESPQATAMLAEECRNETEFQCQTGVSQCISIEEKCDGVFDCEDFSDEYLETCRNEKPRTLLGLILHCSSLWTYMQEKVCPDICQKSAEFCYYALLAENHENNTCILPKYPVNGTYKIMPKDTTAVQKPVDFWLNFTCNAPYVIVQKTLLQCDSGQWNSDTEKNGYCSEACALNKHDNFTYICPMDVYGHVECGDYVAIETTVNVSRAVQDKDSLAKNVSLEILCSIDHEFHFNTGCVEEVDKMQGNFEAPTMSKIVDFERDFKQFKSNEDSKEFKTLEHNFHIFETEVRGNLTLMHVMVEKCDISLDLLLYNLMLKQKKKEEAEYEM